MSERNDCSDGKQINDGRCLFCQNTILLERNVTGDDTWHYRCPYCGEYEVTGSALQEILADPEHDKKKPLGISIRRENVAKEGAFFIGNIYR